MTGNEKQVSFLFQYGKGLLPILSILFLEFSRTTRTEIGVTTIENLFFGKVSYANRAIPMKYWLSQDLDSR